MVITTTIMAMMMLNIMMVIRMVVIACASYEDNDKNAENDGGDASPLLSHMATGLSVQIYIHIY